MVLWIKTILYLNGINMKNIFIGGTSKSGKSTLSNKLKKDIYNHIPLDYFASSFKRNFPINGITSNVVVDSTSSKNLSLFLSRVIEIIDTTNEKFIIDSAHILPEDINKYLDRNKWDIYYLGYPSIDKESKLKDIRKYETKDDWTYNKSDIELLDIFDKLILLSKKEKEMCDKLNIKYIDVSKNVMETINEI